MINSKIPEALKCVSSSECSSAPGIPKLTSASSSLSIDFLFVFSGKARRVETFCYPSFSIFSVVFSCSTEESPELPHTCKRSPMLYQVLA